jgi:hypothetical protein
LSQSDRAMAFRRRVIGVGGLSSGPMHSNSGRNSGDGPWGAGHGPLPAARYYVLYLWCLGPMGVLSNGTANTSKTETDIKMTSCCCSSEVRRAPMSVELHSRASSLLRTCTLLLPPTRLQGAWDQPRRLEARGKPGESPGNVPANPELTILIQ